MAALHATARATLRALGYQLDGDGVVTFGVGSGAGAADNTQWTGSGRDEAWTPGFRP
jgi:hypothetical protein